MTRENSTATNEVPHLMGAKEFGPGSTEAAPSYFIPSFQWTSFVDSNGGYSSGAQKPLFRGSAVASLTLQRVTRKTQLNLNYAGGAQFYTQNVDSTATNSSNSRESTFHQVSVEESVTGRRWGLIVGDSASYLPESPWGFTGFGGLQSFNAGLGGSALSNAGTLNPILQPDQSILTFSRRISNTVIGQVQYSISQRTTVNVMGAYGILHFLDPGFNDENNTSLYTGFTHALDPRNFVGANYFQTLIRFNSAGQDLQQHGVLFSYGHRFPGRLSFEVSGGPSFSQFANPTGASSSIIRIPNPVGAPSSQLANPSGESFSQVFWSIFGSLQYRWRRTDLTTYFGRSTTGGSGVLLGAETNRVGGSIGRLLSRTTYLSVNADYNHDQSLGYSTAQTNRATFKGWGGGLLLSRELGRHLSFYIQYNVRRQVTSSSFCVANRCGETYVQQTGGIGLNWHTRPIRLE